MKKEAKDNLFVEKVIAIKLGSDNKTFLFIQVRKDADNFIVDNGMQYLIYKTPCYENWVTNDELENYGKLIKYLDRTEGKDQYRTGGQKLPDGKFKLVGKADKLTEDQWKELAGGIRGGEYFLESINMKPATTLIIEKL